MMLYRTVSRRIFSACPLPRKSVHRCFISTSFKPLRILFCGADEFSIASLKALHQEHITSPEFIKSINIVCKAGKPHGRGLKKIRHVPIVAAAKELSLPLHQIDTFTGWNCPTPGGEQINIIIAVSFGLKVPPRILNGAKYGGVNVHPSLLPDFRGAAPIQHALLSRCTTTGITLQTLHPHRFDQGRILLQTPSPGFTIPNPQSITPSELTALLAPQGAALLVQGLRNGLFLTSDFTKNETLLERPAPKITQEDSRIKWGSWTVEEILLRHRVVGPLWNIAETLSGISKRIIWPSGFTISDLVLSGSSTGVPIVRPEEPYVYILTVDGVTLRAEHAKVEGDETRPASQALMRARMSYHSFAEQVRTASSLS
jgi:methionyl-tRNA formyltransferase